MAQIEVPDEVLAQLRTYAERNGLTESEALRRWLREWLRENGYEVPPSP